MIRKLKAGEEIKDGDFYTGNDLPDGDRVSVSAAVFGEKVKSRISFPIFREIPDTLSVGGITLDFIGHGAVDNPIGISIDSRESSESLRVAAARQISKWLLEISEAME